MEEISLGPGVELSGRRPLVAVGDLAVVGALLSLGMLRHGVRPVVQTEHAALVVAPFLFGWIVAAPLVGAYADEAFRSVRDATEAVAGAWLGAVLVGAALRATAAFPGNAPLEFVAVVFGFGLVALGAWRALASLVVS